MSESKNFKLIDNLDAVKVGRAVENFLRAKKNLIAEGTPTTEGFFLQAKEQAGWKKFIGMDLAIQVQILQTQETLNVQIGTGKWVDKLAAGGVGIVLFAPLAVTAAIGAYMQKKLPSQIFDYIEKFIMSGGKDVNITMSMHQTIDKSQVICPNCKASVDKNVKFCPSCGGKLFIECPNCKSKVGLGQKFCPECGSTLNEEKTCPHCNAKLSDNSKFCSNCGKEV